MIEDDEAVELTRQIKAMALEEGFDRVGVTTAGVLGGRERFEAWLAEGCHAEMTYLDRNVDMRFEPAKLVEGASSVICLACRCDGLEQGSSGKTPRTGEAFISRYARGRDYHKVLKKRCHRLMDRIAAVRSDFFGRAFVDSAPINERGLAAAAGLGWIGRNGCIIVPGLGSYVLLCEIVTNLPLKLDREIDGSCGECRRCVEACPTGACRGDGLVDARRCISYLTIEHAGQIPPEVWPKMGSRVFGCDECQQACPHNNLIISDARRPSAADSNEFQPTDWRVALEEILSWGESEWDNWTRGTARRRASFEMLLRNAIIAAGDGGSRDAIARLEKLRVEHSEWGDMIDWAIGYINERG